MRHGKNGLHARRCERALRWSKHCELDQVGGWTASGAQALQLQADRSNQSPCYALLRHPVCTKTSCRCSNNQMRELFMAWPRVMAAIRYQMKTTTAEAPLSVGRSFAVSRNARRWLLPSDGRGPSSRHSCVRRVLRSARLTESAPLLGVDCVPLGFGPRLATTRQPRLPQSRAQTRRVRSRFRLAAS